MNRIGIETISLNSNNLSRNEHMRKAQASHLCSLNSLRCAMGSTGPEEEQLQVSKEYYKGLK